MATTSYDPNEEEECVTETYISELRIMCNWVLNKMEEAEKEGYNFCKLKRIAIHILQEF